MRMEPQQPQKYGGMQDALRLLQEAQLRRLQDTWAQKMMTKKRL
jgi:hypothetical protein